MSVTNQQLYESLSDLRKEIKEDMGALELKVDGMVSHCDLEDVEDNIKVNEKDIKYLYKRDYFVILIVGLFVAILRFLS